MMAARRGVDDHRVRHEQVRSVTIIPLAPRTSRAIDFYIDERTTGPIFPLFAKAGGQPSLVTARR